jgi:hypothetical protein
VPVIGRASSNGTDAGPMATHRRQPGTLHQRSHQLILRGLGT